MKTSEVLDRAAKIMSYKTYSTRRKIDSLLELDSMMYTERGIDSTLSEMRETKKASKRIYRMIADISPVDGFLLRALSVDIPEIE
jgi:hypothetical protein